MVNLATYAFISGLVFFIGLALAALVVALWQKTEKKILRSILTMCGIIAVLLVGLSATPIPYVLTVVWTVAFSFAWIMTARHYARAHWFNRAFYALTLALAGWETRFHLPVSIPTNGYDTLCVVGDSLSMGAEPPHKNWPDILGDKLGMTTRTFSFGGARTDTALPNAKRIDKDDCLVILEIGGNDLLYGTEGFEANLDALLATVCNGKRSVVMLELPLPPTFNNFGIAQRRLARKHGVTLIPKRYLAHVLTTHGATDDGLHLSNEGHTLLADTLRSQFSQPKK